MASSVGRKIATAVCAAGIALLPVAGASATFVRLSPGETWDYGTHGLIEAWSVYVHPTRRHKASVYSWNKNFQSPCVIPKDRAEAHIYAYIGRASMYHNVC